MQFKNKARNAEGEMRKMEKHINSSFFRNSRSAISIFFFSFISVTGLFFGSARAADPFDVVESSGPLGSPFYRHLAFDFDLDMKKLAQYEERGFGRGEIITLVLLSKMTGTPLKDYGNRRLQERVRLEMLAEEAGIDYVTLHKAAQVVKEGIEAKGARNLPPPVFGKPGGDTSESDGTKPETKNPEKDPK